MIIVTGANGVVGQPLCRTLTKLQLPYHTVSRQPSTQIQWDLQQPLSEQNSKKLKGVTCLVHCAPIWLLPDHIESLSKLGVKRVVVFSSTSVIAKQNASNPHDRQLVERLQQAEQSLIEQAQKCQIDLTLFRPSMIYGYGKDQNVMHIANIIRRYRCMLIVGKAKGLRQPVHVNDLVDAVLAVLDNPQTYNKQYNLAGQEVLAYSEMVRRIFLGLKRTPRLFPIPLLLFRTGLMLADKLSGFSYNADMANRMNQNLIYDYKPATDDFGYQPQAFLLHPERDL